MQRIGEAFYGHAQALRAALAAHDPRELVDVLRRNVYGWNPGDAASRLAAYVREAARALAALDGVRVARGQLRFPDPLTIPAAAD